MANLKPFPKGESGNPGGRPRGRSFAALKRSFLMEADPEDARGRTRGEVLLDKAYELAVGGDRQALRDLLDRVDGRPHQTLTITTERREQIEREVERIVDEAAALGEAVTREAALRALEPYIPEVSELISEANH